MGANIRRCGVLTLALLVIFLGAQPALAGKPGASGHVTPTAVEPFPDDSARPDAGTKAAPTSGGVAHPHGNPPASKPAPSLTLGQPANVSLEIKKGNRTGYQLDATGKVIGQKRVDFKATEADSASRWYRQGATDYYLLTWGPLNGNWFKLDTTSSRVLPSAAWKELVLVFSDTNLDYVDAAGATHHLEATMTPTHRDLMVDAVQRAPGLATTWSASLVAPTTVVVDVAEPLTSLTPLGDGAYWLGPWDVQAAISTYAPPGAYDSVIAIWQPWEDPTTDPVTGAVVPGDNVDSWGWGLSIDSTSDANGAAWSTLTVPPAHDGENRDWWISSAEFVGEPFVHEWLHNVMGYYQRKGFAVPDLHANDQYRYSADAQGSWWRWYNDLLQQHVLDPRTHKYVGINYLDWQYGTPSTRP